MKSKRSPYIVITDDNIKMEMHFFSDGTKGMIIHCKKKHLLKLAKEIQKNKNSKFIHLSPEISIFINDTDL